MPPKPWIPTIPWITGYCTNIHAGPDLATLRTNLTRFAADVRRKAYGDGTLGVGLWVANEAAEELVVSETSLRALGQQMSELGLRPYTFNGFPFGNFHQPIVKHRVYQPTWLEPARLAFTQNLVRILASLLPAGSEGSISTLPIGWGPMDHEQKSVAAGQLSRLADFLRKHESSTGQRIVVAIEPEPGCSLDTSQDVVNFFEQYLPTTTHRRYLTVCHDVCHAAVMFENQIDVLQRYATHGITVGKIQVSSAIEVRWHEMDMESRQRALQQLSMFAEDRYLHQTGRIDASGQFQLCEDLPALLRTDWHANDYAWCIHFHVPIFLDRFDYLCGTRSAIIECLQAIEQTPEHLRVNHLEVETYAWGVLPESMRQRSLAESIATEMIWLEHTLTSGTAHHD